MGPKHSSEQILDAAVRVVLRTGLNGVTFRLVAEEAQTSDRVVVYYFAEKAELLTALLGRAGEQLQLMLAASLPSGEKTLTREALLRSARPVFTDPEQAWVIRVFLEAIGLAVAGTEPFSSLAPTLLDQWISWFAKRIDNGQQRSSASFTVAVIDGLMIIGALLGADAAAAAWNSAIDDAARAGL